MCSCARWRPALPEAGGLQDEAGVLAQGVGHELDLVAGVAGEVEGHGLAGQRLERELVDVEGARAVEVGDGERDAEQAVGDAVGAEVLAGVVGVQRAGHVLGVLDVLRDGFAVGADGLQGAGHGEEHVAGAGLAHGDGREPVGDVVVVNGFEIVAFEAEVEEGRLRILGVDRVQLDELMVVDLDERFVRNIVAAEVEGLLEAKGLVKGDGSGEVVHADGDVGDASERRRLLGLREWREGEGENEQEAGDWAQG